MLEKLQDFFPIDSIDSLCKFVINETFQSDPSLIVVSLVLGYFEVLLTTKKSPNKMNNESSEEEINHHNPLQKSDFPTLTYESLRLLHNDFLKSFSGLILDKEREPFQILDVLLGSLSQRLVREKSHIQNLYSFVTAKQLDCFGISFALVSVCQELGLADVHLCLSEDHVWVKFGSGISDLCEVTWHGKSEERARLCVNSSSSWLYLGGSHVYCSDRKLEIAAAVNAMNPVVEFGVDSFELATIQQKLLSHFYNNGIIRNYPLAISNLANLNELLHLTTESSDVSKTFQVAIISARQTYNNRHVFPYTYYGGYLLRNLCLKGALWCWTEAANVLSFYSYCREDEEVFKEMHDFTVDVLPGVFKLTTVESTLLKESLLFALIIKFYDGLCLWEEDSLMPVLHANSARAMFLCIWKFSFETRSGVEILQEDSDVPSTFSSLTMDKMFSIIGEGLCPIEKNALLFLSNNSSLSLKVSKNNHKIGIYLSSKKMIGLKNLLFATRLQPGAIQLQLSAQSTTTSLSVPSDRHRYSKRRRTNSVVEKKN